MPREAMPGRHDVLLPLLIVSVASLAARRAIAEPGVVWFWLMGAVAAYAVAALVLAYLDLRGAWSVRGGGEGARPSPLAIVLVVALLVGPFVEGAGRVFSAAHFRPLEQVTIHALTNVAFLAAAMPRWRRGPTGALSVSFVLLMAAVMLGTHEAIGPMAAMYAGLCAVWFARAHWGSICSASSGEATGRLPMIPVLAMVALMVGLTAASGRFAGGAVSIWREWAPSSGGSRWSNTDALLGVGDGDWVVSGPNARSTGSVDSEYFLESDLPTLYDVMSDSYGEARSPKELQRAVFVSQQQMLAREGHKAADAGAAAPQFSLYRQGRSPQRPVDRCDGDALLYVRGPAPLHLAMTVYEYFDGIAWHEPPESDEICRLDARDADVSWLWLRDEHACLPRGGRHEHELRLGRLSSDRLPLPSYLERFRLGRSGGENVRRWALETFAWAHEGILRARQCLPSGTFLEVVSRRVDRARLEHRCGLFDAASSQDPCLQVPDHLRCSAESLAERFVQTPHGMPQIEAIIAHLRTHFAHHRDMTLPPTCTDPVHHFLNESKGGPAYQFATAAALALRSLGYPTRVVAGFYASPADYVARAGHTPIHADDAHFWIQVRTANRDWLTLDPTPGYEVEWHRPTLWSRLVDEVAALVRAVTNHPFIALAGAAIIILAWRRRLWIAERLLTWRCLLWPYRRGESRLRDALALLDLRSRLHGRARPASRTPLDWYGQIDEPACRAFLDRLYVVLYGPRDGDAARDVALARDCASAVRRVGPRVLRAGARFS